jgi:hypothetical protein
LFAAAAAAAVAAASRLLLALVCGIDLNATVRRCLTVLLSLAGGAASVKRGTFIFI